MKTLECERLILRDWNILDLNDFDEISSSRKLSDLAGFRLKTSIEDSLKSLEQFIAASDDSTMKVRLKELDRVVFWAIELKKSNKVVGWFELCEATCKPKDEAYKYIKEIGFVLAEEYWGQGLIPEVIKRVLSYLFNEEEIEAVVCSHFKDNYQSEKAIKKCGFKFFSEDDEEKYYYIANNEIAEI